MRTSLLPYSCSLMVVGAFCAGVVGLAAEADQAAHVESISSEQRAFFEKKIRPLLVAKCYQCHSTESEKVKGGLLLDTREGIRLGGETGHAVTPGNLKDSLLIKAVRWESKDFQMPPKEKLSAEAIADLEKWVSMGAPDPRDGKAKVVKKPDLAEDKNFWAFQPVKPVAVPRPKDTKWSTSDIDRLVLKKLEEKQLKPVGDADPATLLRRLHFDLIGLPPSPDQVQAFVKEANSGNRQSAMAKVVDQLLASPQFGERWGRHWLDVARYAESCGKERNYAFPQAWRYRDYVIAAFNEDKPYDRFIREQVAGDLLPAKDAAQRNEQLIATGFLALGPKGLNERNREAFLMEQVDEQIDVTTRAVLGLTVSCARCHDHKFDPIPTRDYYALAGIFKSTDTHFGISGGSNAKSRQPSTLVPLVKTFNTPPPAAASIAPVKEETTSPSKNSTAEIEARLKKLIESNPKLAARFKNMTEAQKVAAFERLQGNPKAAKAAKAAKSAKYPETPEAPKLPGEPSGDEAMAVIDGRAADSPIYVRGELEEKGPVIPRGFVTVLGATEPAKIAPGQSGRLELANWLTSPANPLTARVMANRVWQHLFGKGLVTTADNFGATGERPTNPELLDYLANCFVANQWSVKQLVREVVLSRTYQLSSASNAKNFVLDPANDFLWRANQRRLDAESIRDGILAASGQLDLSPANGSVVSQIGDAPIGKGGRSSPLQADSRHRSVYLPIVREMLPDSLSLFDFAEPSLVVANRDVTNVPSQALYMLNSPFISANSAAMAKALPQDADVSSRLTTAYLRALSRPPTSAELARAGQYIAKLSAEPGCSPDTAWATFCQALLASAEFRYVK